MSSSSDLRRPFLIMGGIVAAVVVAVAVVVVVTLTSGDSTASSSDASASPSSSVPMPDLPEPVENPDGYIFAGLTEPLREAVRALYTGECAPMRDGCSPHLAEIHYVVEHVRDAAAGPGDARASVVEEATTFDRIYDEYQQWGCDDGFDANMPSGKDCAMAVDSLRSSVNMLRTDMASLCVDETARSEDECYTVMDD